MKEYSVMMIACNVNSMLCLKLAKGMKICECKKKKKAQEKGAKSTFDLHTQRELYSYEKNSTKKDCTTFVSLGHSQRATTLMAE